MAGILYDQVALIDTSAVIALLDPHDRFHQPARQFFDDASEMVWFTANITAHEAFTRVRYDYSLDKAIAHFDYLRGRDFRVLAFDATDERAARDLARKYDDQTFSFHDVLCAVVMLRAGIYKVFTFDRDFWILGFEVLPGITL